MKQLWRKLREYQRGIQFDDPLQDFTPRARTVFGLAKKHSARLRHNFIGTEHLILGLIEVGQGVAFNVLKRSGVNLEDVRQKVEECVGLGPDKPCSFRPPFTPRLKRVLELAHEERKALQHTYLGTEHLLLGILREGNGVAARVLKQCKLNLDQTRQEILRELDPNFIPRSSNVITSSFIEKGNPELQDRLSISSRAARMVIAVADGAGGISGGAQAAELFLQLVEANSAGLQDAESCQRLLQRIDQEISKANDCGETTGIVVVITADGLFGAGVGDSAAWLFSGETQELLTNGQRKPFLGSGSAWAVSFSKPAVIGTLVVATDGLWKYASLERIAEKVRTVAPEILAHELAQLVRLKSGAFPDDIAIITSHIS
jgi:serine/threonine protein phosphatase PrpC